MDDSTKQEPSGEWPTLEAIEQWAREAAENLPSMERLTEKWIDSSTFLDEDSLPRDEDEK